MNEDIDPSERTPRNSDAEDAPNKTRAKPTVTRNGALARARRMTTILSYLHYAFTILNFPFFIFMH